MNFFWCLNHDSQNSRHNKPPTFKRLVCSACRKKNSRKISIDLKFLTDLGGSSFKEILEPHLVFSYYDQLEWNHSEGMRPTAAQFLDSVITGWVRADHGLLDQLERF